MAVAPSLLLLLVGSDLIRADRRPLVQRGRRAAARLVADARARPLDASATETSRVHARAARARDRAARAARRRGPGAAAAHDRGAGARARARPRHGLRAGGRDRVRDGPAAAVAGVLGRGVGRGARRRRAARDASGRGRSPSARAGSRGSPCRCTAPDGRPAGAVVVSTFLPPEVASAVREVQDRYTKFRKTQTYREPILAFYRSLYLFPALLHPVRRGLARALPRAAHHDAAAARRGGRRAHRGRRARRARRLPDGQRRVPRADRVLQPHVGAPRAQRGGGRVLARRPRAQEPGAGGAPAPDRGRARDRRHGRRRRRPGGRRDRRQRGGRSGCSSSSRAPSACRSSGCCKGPGRDEIRALVLRLLSGRVSRQEREVIVPSRERDRHLAVTVVSLPGSLGSAPGALVVVDDLTPLMRAQKVAAWGEVARKLAHEIKNPLTPIQLSAQRIRKAWLKSDPGFERIVDRVHARDRRRGGGAQEPRRRVRAVRAAAGGEPAAGRARRRDRAGAVALRRPLSRASRSSGGSPPTCRSCGSTPTRSSAC